MAQKNLMKFYELINVDEKLKNKFSEIVKVLNDEKVGEKEINEVKKKIIALGKEYGFTFTDKEFTESLTEIAAKANEAGVLSDEDLEEISGGLNRRFVALSLAMVTTAGLGGAAIQNLVTSQNTKTSTVAQVESNREKKAGKNAGQGSKTIKAKINEADQDFNMDAIKLDDDGLGGAGTAAGGPSAMGRGMGRSMATNGKATTGSKRSTSNKAREAQARKELERFLKELEKESAKAGQKTQLNKGSKSEAALLNRLQQAIKQDQGAMKTATNTAKSGVTGNVANKSANAQKNAYKEQKIAAFFNEIGQLDMDNMSEQEAAKKIKSLQTKYGVSDNDLQEFQKKALEKSQQVSAELESILKQDGQSKQQVEQRLKSFKEKHGIPNEALPDEAIAQIAAEYAEAQKTGATAHRPGAQKQQTRNSTAKPTETSGKKATTPGAPGTTAPKASSTSSKPKTAEKKGMKSETQNKLANHYTNLTNTCYLRSALWQLYNNAAIRNAVTSSSSDNAKVVALKDLFNSMNGNKIDKALMTKFVNSFNREENSTIKNNIYDGSQLDTTETYEKIVNALTETGLKTESLQVKDVSSGTQQNLNAVAISVKGLTSAKKTLTNLIDKDGKYTNAYGKNLQIEKAPSVLAFSLGRSGDMNKVISDSLDVPETLNVLDSNYELKTVTVYHGSGAGGHYYVYVKDGALWKCINDDTISDKSFGEIKNEIATSAVMATYSKVGGTTKAKKDDTQQTQTFSIAKSSKWNDGTKQIDYEEADKNAQTIELVAENGVLKLDFNALKPNSKVTVKGEVKELVFSNVSMYNPSLMALTEFAKKISRTANKVTIEGNSVISPVTLGASPSQKIVSKSSSGTWHYNGTILEKITISKNSELNDWTQPRHSYNNISITLQNSVDSVPANAFINCKNVTIEVSSQELANKVEQTIKAYKATNNIKVMLNGKEYVAKPAETNNNVIKPATSTTQTIKPLSGNVIKPLDSTAAIPTSGNIVKPATSTTQTIKPLSGNVNLTSQPSTTATSLTASTTGKPLTISPINVVKSVTFTAPTITSLSETANLTSLPSITPIKPISAAPKIEEKARKEEEQRKQQEQERKQKEAEEQARKEKEERIAREKAEEEERLRKEAEEKARQEEEERLAREKAEEEKERIAREKAEKEERLHKEAERKQKEEEERRAREKADAEEKIKSFQEQLNQFKQQYNELVQNNCTDYETLNKFYNDIAEFRSKIDKYCNNKVNDEKFKDTIDKLIENSNDLSIGIVLQIIDVQDQNEKQERLAREKAEEEERLRKEAEEKARKEEEERLRKEAEEAAKKAEEERKQKEAEENTRQGEEEHKQEETDTTKENQSNTVIPQQVEESNEETKQNDEEIENIVVNAEKTQALHFSSSGGEGFEIENENDNKPNETLNEETINDTNEEKAETAKSTNKKKKKKKSAKNKNPQEKLNQLNHRYKILSNDDINSCNETKKMKSLLKDMKDFNNDNSEEMQKLKTIQQDAMKTLQERIDALQNRIEQLEKTSTKNTSNTFVTHHFNKNDVGDIEVALMQKNNIPSATSDVSIITNNENVGKKTQPIVDEEIENIVVKDEIAKQKQAKENIKITSNEGLLVKSGKPMTLHYSDESFGFKITDENGNVQQINMPNAIDENTVNELKQKYSISKKVLRSILGEKITPENGDPFYPVNMDVVANFFKANPQVLQPLLLKYKKQPLQIEQNKEKIDAAKKFAQETEKGSFLSFGGYKDYKKAGDNFKTTNDGTLEIGNVNGWSSVVFLGRDDITKLNFGDKKITTIHNCQFAGCYNLKNVELPDGVKNIHTKAFAHCFNLGKITIPSSIEKIESGAFDNIDELTIITPDYNTHNKVIEQLKKYTNTTNKIKDGSFKFFVNNKLNRNNDDNKQNDVVEKAANTTQINNKKEITFEQIFIKVPDENGVEQQVKIPKAIQELLEEKYKEPVKMLFEAADEILKDKHGTTNYVVTFEKLANSLDYHGNNQKQNKLRDMLLKPEDHAQRVDVEKLSSAKKTDSLRLKKTSGTGKSKQTVSNSEKNKIEVKKEELEPIANQNNNENGNDKQNEIQAVSEEGNNGSDQSNTQNNNGNGNDEQDEIQNDNESDNNGNNQNENIDMFDTSEFDKSYKEAINEAFAKAHSIINGENVTFIDLQNAVNYLDAIESQLSEEQNTELVELKQIAEKKITELTTNYKFSKESAGNTCYLRSALWQLYHNPAIRNAVLTSDSENAHIKTLKAVFEKMGEGSNGHIDNNLLANFVNTFNRYETVTEKGFFGGTNTKQVVKNDLYDGSQKDCSEACKQIINTLEKCDIKLDKIKIKTEQKIVSKTDNTEISTNADNADNIELTVTDAMKNGSLQNCIKNDGVYETTDLDDYKVNGTVTPSIKTTAIASTPDNITFNLNRTGYDAKKDTSIRIADRLDIDETIEINGQKYTLKTATVYDGSGSRGHYYIYVKDSAKWQCFDNVWGVKECTFNKIKDKLATNAVMVTYEKWTDPINTKFNNETIKLTQHDMPELLVQHLKEETLDLSNTKITHINSLLNQFCTNNANEVKKIILPGSVEKIEVLAFSGFKKLEEVTLLGNADAMKAGAFDEKVKITDKEGHDVSEWNNKEQRKKIEQDKEARATKAKEREQKEIAAKKFAEETEKGSFLSFGGYKDYKEAGDKFTTTKGTLKVDDVKGWSSVVFLGREDITKLEFGSKPITTINNYQFAGCYNLSNVVLPEGVKNINTNAFAHCFNLGKIFIPSSIEKIETGAFDNIDELTITVPDAKTATKVYDQLNKDTIAANKIKDGKFKIVIGSGKNMDDNNYVWRCYSSEIKAVNGTLDVSGWAQDDVRFALLKDHKDIKNLVLPAQLSDDVIKELKQGLESVEELSFADGTTKLPALALQKWKNLKKVTVPEGVTEIPKEYFSNCENLEKVDLPSSVTTIFRRAFAGCIKLDKIKLPKNLKALGEEAFLYCLMLESLELPDGLTTIGTSALNCNKLKTLYIPISVTTVEKGAIPNNSELKVTAGNLEVKKKVLDSFSSQTNTKVEWVKEPEINEYFEEIDKEKKGFPSSEKVKELLTKTFEGTDDEWNDKINEKKKELVVSIKGAIDIGFNSINTLINGATFDNNNTDDYNSKMDAFAEGIRIINSCKETIEKCKDEIDAVKAKGKDVQTNDEIDISSDSLAKDCNTVIENLKKVGFGSEEPPVRQRVLKAKELLDDYKKQWEDLKHEKDGRTIFGKLFGTTDTRQEEYNKLYDDVYAMKLLLDKELPVVENYSNLIEFETLRKEYNDMVRRLQGLQGANDNDMKIGTALHKGVTANFDDDIQMVKDLTTKFRNGQTNTGELLKELNDKENELNNKANQNPSYYSVYKALRLSCIIMRDSIQNNKQK